MITYYTDGSCSPNPGPGGFAAIKDTELVIVGHEDMSTNIRMEGRAIEASLKNANGEECKICTDSEFWVNTVTKWGHSWKANGWMKKSGEIKNIDMVKEIFELYQASKAELIWVRGHIGILDNEIADDWANKARIQKLDGQYLSSESDENYKK